MILLDSHVWLWWTNNTGALPPRYLESLEHSDDTIGVSAISAWELSLACRKGRLILTTDFKTWMDQSVQDLGLVILPLDESMAFEANNLPGDLHADLADRLIVATARTSKAQIATFDAKILAYPHVQIFQP